MHKEIDLSLDRIKNLCKKLGNPQDKIKVISVVGTNGKFYNPAMLMQFLKKQILNVMFTQVHIFKRKNESFVFNNQELNDDELI